MPDSSAAPSLYAARPKFFIAQQEESALAELLVELSIEETADGLCRCEATFTNWGPRDGATGFLFFDRQLLEFGKELRIEMGAGQSAGTVFEGKITALEGRFTGSRPPEIIIYAEDRLQDLRMTRRTRTFEQMSDADVIRQVAQQHGLQANVNANGPTHAVVAQLNQSDLAFCRERARAVDAELWVEGSQLHVQPRSQRSAGNVTLTFGEGLKDFAVVADLAGQVTGFTVTGWDVSGKQAITHKAQGSSVSGELEGGQSGSTILQSALGNRVQQVVHHMPLTATEAQALAEAHFKRLARRFLMGNGATDADARIRVGTKLTLGGLGTMFDGKYYVSRTRHVFDSARGSRSLFTAERPGL